jgi:hypothetical protein
MSGKKAARICAAGVNPVAQREEQIMLKRMMIVVGVIVAAVAIAQVNGRVVGAVGRGAAGNGENRAGHFGLDVKKFMRAGSHHAEYAGRFEWSEITTEASHRFGISMSRPAAVGVDMENHVCEFGGPARLRRMGASGPIVIEGRIQVRVVDRRHQGKGEPDLISWHFISPAHNIELGFNGGVREGDIHVFARNGN